MANQSEDFYEPLRKTEASGIRFDAAALERATKIIWAESRRSNSTRTVTPRPPPPPQKKMATCSHLPIDILLRIFYICLSDGNGGAIELPMRQDGVVWILSRVCSAWRQVVTNDALTWTRTQIRFSPAIPKGVLNQASKTCLQRSHKCPIHLAISCRLHPTDYCSQSRYIQGFFSTILKHSSGRIQTVTLDIDPALYPHLSPAVARNDAVFMSVTDLRMMSLAEIPSESNWWQGSQGATNFLRYHATTQMPKLSKVTLSTSSPGLPWNMTTNIGIPWTQYTHITLNHFEISLDTAYDILQGCNRLVFLSLNVGISDFGISDLTGGWGSWGWKTSESSLPMNLPALRHLVLSSRSSALWEFLQSLHAPSLDHLKIYYARKDYAGQIGWYFDDTSTHLTLPSKFTALITGFEHLKMLELCDVRPVDFSTIIRSLPLLERLDACTSSVFPVGALQSIRVGECGKMLTHLKLALTNAGIMAFFDLIESQWKSGPNGSASRAMISHARITVVEPGKRLHDTFNRMAAKLKKTTQGQFDILFLPG